ncbi:MAG: helix-turn-helix domain-containing protein [Ruminococcus sp.]|nr:helix-turn-helix domain-containing protein [Ruminococcus sp.]
MKIRERYYNVFKMPNDIFEKHLTCSELTVLATVYSLRSRSIYQGNKYIKISQKSIAAICGFKSTATVSKAIEKLCLLGYITRINRYYDDYKKLGTNVYTIPTVRGKYFFVSRQIFKYHLTTAQMRMYLFFCKCSDSRSKRFWNSYNDICQTLKLKRSAVIKTITELCDMGLIKKYRITKKDGSYSDNHYKVIKLLPPKRKIHKKRRCRFAPASSPVYISKHKTNCTFMINLYNQKVNIFLIFFYLRGSPKICSSLYSTHSIPPDRKNRIKLYLKYRCNLTFYGS